MSYTKEELHYLVGIFDGEGCVASALRQNGKYLTLHLAITNTNKKLIDYLQSKIGGSSFYFGTNYKSRTPEANLEVYNQLRDLNKRGR